jgi:hemerythrin-like domain-containing protein
MTTEKKPIKRSPYIVALSRDHHHTLLLCWKIRQGIAKNIAAARIAAYALHFDKLFLKTHFRQEEELLFTKLPPVDELGRQGIGEHASIRALLEKISLQPSYAALNEFEFELDNHIRFEERTLFPHIEKKLSEQQLQYAAEVLDKEHQSPDDNWEDIFWVKQ